MLQNLHDPGFVDPNLWKTKIFYFLKRLGFSLYQIEEIVDCSLVEHCRNFETSVMGLRSLTGAPSCKVSNLRSTMCRELYEFDENSWTPTKIIIKRSLCTDGQAWSGCQATMSAAVCLVQVHFLLSINWAVEQQR